ncbi:MAG: type II toxin-antitoxin system Phd/YefM family antitoxin [Actinomycetota bacterium]|nr:type II toxin-antitoxin system Phd/YefM family antitoxin [Actinomycetota bacterium]
MSRRYSIAEARHDLAAIVHELEGRDLIELTRRGEPVAVMLSLSEYRRLTVGREKFWDAYLAFRETVDLSSLGIEQDIFERDPSPGREVRL